MPINSRRPAHHGGEIERHQGGKDAMAMEASIVNWLNTFPLEEPVTSLSDLADGLVFYGVPSSIPPRAERLLLPMSKLTLPFRESQSLTLSSLCLYPYTNQSNQRYSVVSPPIASTMMP